MKHLTKKLSTGILVMLVAILILPGCKDNKEDATNSLFGTWVHTEAMSLLTVEYKYVFNPDYTFTWSSLGTELVKGRFTLEGDEITCIPDNESFAITKLVFYSDSSQPRIYDPELDIEYTKQ